MFHPYVYPLFATSPYLTERLAVDGVSQTSAKLPDCRR